MVARRILSREHSGAPSFSMHSTPTRSLESYLLHTGETVAYGRVVLITACLPFSSPARLRVSQKSMERALQYCKVILQLQNKP